MSTEAQTLQIMLAYGLMAQQSFMPTGIDVYSYTCLPTIKVKRGKAVKVRDNKQNPKIGRNHLCPCGSGLKFKKCCNLRLK